MLWSVRLCPRLSQLVSLVPWLLAEVVDRKGRPYLKTDRTHHDGSLCMGRGEVLIRGPSWEPWRGVGPAPCIESGLRVCHGSIDYSGGFVLIGRVGEIPTNIRSCTPIVSHIDTAKSGQQHRQHGGTKLGRNPCQENTSRNDESPPLRRASCVAACRGLSARPWCRWESHPGCIRRARPTLVEIVLKSTRRYVASLGPDSAGIAVILVDPDRVRVVVIQSSPIWATHPRRLGVCLAVTL